MNILGFVTGLLMIFAISSHVLWEKRLAQEKIDLSYRGYLQASRQIQNLWESKQFGQIKDKKNIKKIPIISETKGSSLAKKIRRVPNSSECAKINIYPLLSSDKNTNQELYQTLTALISFQYGDKKFYQEFAKTHTPHSLLDEILKAAKLILSDPTKPLYLEKLDLKDPQIKQVYYHMLKGTKNYTSDNKGNYPSLLWLLKADKENQKEKICLSCAPLALLEALFPQKVAESIDRERQQKALSQDTLNKIYSDTHYLPSVNIQNMIQPIHSKKKKKDQLSLSGTDTDTEISIERTYQDTRS